MTIQPEDGNLDDVLEAMAKMWFVKGSVLLSLMDNTVLL